MWIKLLSVVSLRVPPLGIWHLMSDFLSLALSSPHTCFSLHACLKAPAFFSTFLTAHLLFSPRLPIRTCFLLYFSHHIPAFLSTPTLYAPAFFSTFLSTYLLFSPRLPIRTCFLLYAFGYFVPSYVQFPFLPSYHFKISSVFNWAKLMFSVIC
jgi:hypothetical protein